jgi:hypothetical protein
LSEESLFREVDEEVRQEQFKKLWERYGNAIIALCMIVVAGVAGFKGWQYWQLKQSEAAAETFFEAVRLAGTGKPDDAIKQLAGVNHTGFAHLAKLREAGILASQGKAEDAVKVYDAVAADTSVDPSLRDLAKIRAGYVLAESLKPDELTARVGSFDTPGGHWRHAAREIIAIAAWRTRDYALADRTVNAILADPETPGGLRQRAETLSQLLLPLLGKK